MRKYRRIVCEALRSARVDEESRRDWLRPSRLGTQPERNKKSEIPRFGVEHFRNKSFPTVDMKIIGVPFSAQLQAGIVLVTYSYTFSTL